MVRTSSQNRTGWSEVVSSTGTTNENPPADSASSDEDIIVDADPLADQAIAISEVFDHLSVGVMIVDAGNRARLTNRYADEVLKEGDGLFLELNCLKAVSSKVTRELNEAIRLASSGVGKPQLALSILRPSCLKPLLSLVAPAGTGFAVLFIADPEREPSIRPSLIEDLMGLTSTESTVAALVTKGKRVSQIAETLKISAHTVRFHLRHVFSKTGTVQQADLANYVGSLLGKLRTGDAKNDNGL